VIFEDKPPEDILNSTVSPFKMRNLNYKKQYSDITAH